MTVLRLRHREQWGAMPAQREHSPNRNPVTKVFFTYHTPVYGWHCNNTRQCLKIMNEMQRIHIEEYGLSDIAYHFVVAADGHVYEGRDLKSTSPFCLKYDYAYRCNRIDIAFMGDYLRSEPPTKMIELSFLAAGHCITKRLLHKLYTYSKIKEVFENPRLIQDSDQESDVL